MFDSSFIDKIKQNITVFDLANKLNVFNDIKKCGNFIYKSRCPNPNHIDNDPSFVIDVKNNRWYCNGCHHGKKDLNANPPNYGTDCFALYIWIQDVIYNRKINFNDALYELCKLYNIAIEKPKYKYSYNYNEILANTYNYNLYNGINNYNALSYLHGRGITDNEIKEFGLGLYSGTTFNDDKIVFPLYDKYKKVIGFNFRNINHTKEKGYKNNYNNAIFNKSNYFYGIDKLDDNFDEIRITEGCTDVILSYKYGLRNVVSLLGCNITDEHINMIQQMGKKPVLIYDNDKVGEEALKKTVKLFSEKSIYCKIFILPKNMDLCEYSLEVKQNIEKNISLYSITYQQYKIDKIINAYNNVKNQFKLKIIDDLINIIDMIPTEKERIIFINYINKQLELNLEEVIKKYGM